MRTTLSIDDDRASGRLNARRSQQRSLGEVHSALARQGLTPRRAVSRTRSGITLLPASKRRPSRHARSRPASARRVAVTVHLLDVSVLIALHDPDHVQHDRAHDWFERSGRTAWATCPITQQPSRAFSAIRAIQMPVARLPASCRTCAISAHFPVMSSGPTTSVFSMPGELMRTGCWISVRSPTLICWRWPRPMMEIATFDRRLVPDAVPQGQVHRN